MAKQGGYNPDNDKRLAEVVAFNNERTELRVGIYRYGIGEPKIQISRLERQQGEARFGKVGRMTMEEFIGVARAVKELDSRGVFKSV